MGSGIVAQVTHSSLSGIHELNVILPTQTPGEAVFVPTGKILFETDTNLYRFAANILKTDDSLEIVRDINAGGGYRVAYEDFFQNDIPADQVSTKISRLASAATSPQSLIVMRTGSITAVGIRGNAAVTAGTITVSVFKNAVPIGLTAQLNTTDPTFKFINQAKDADSFVGGDILDLNIVSVGLAPAGTLDVRCILEIEY